MVVPSAEKLANLVFQQFEQLPKTGKPTTNEWAILSAILKHDTAKDATEVVAIGCGTKCVGKSKLCSDGLLVNDSHAEVLARRAFLRYIYYHLKQAIQTSVVSDEYIFHWDSENVNFRIRPDLSFHFVSTQTPCGDACIRNEAICGRSTEQTNDGPTLPKLRKMNNENEKYAPNFDDNVGTLLEPMTNAVYTGAKLIGLGHQQDAMQQKIGAVRTKPGRGDRTLSMSCSDKLARWNVLGVQGALQDALLTQPIYFETLNFIGAGENEDAIRRAIYERFTEKQFKTTKYNVQKPKIRFAENVTFEYAENSNRKNPSPSGISWCNISEHLKPYEISVNGKRQGVTRKKLSTPQAALRISKYHLLHEFVEILRLQPKLREKLEIEQNELNDLKYLQYKQLAKDYQAAWTLAKLNYFEQWTEKPQSLLEFSLGGAKTS